MLNHYKSPGAQHAPSHRMRRSACATAFAGALTAGLLQPAAAEITPSLVPADLEVPAGHEPVLVGHAAGTQNYVCLRSGPGFAWAFFGPQATLFDDDENQLITHFLSPNPDEGGTPRATWQHSGDTSSVWATAIASSSDPAFVAPGAIPWLLLEVVGAEDGPTGGASLSETTFIQRLYTAGGIAPASGCSRSADVGKKALVPYTTDYYFYEATDD